MGGGVAVRVLQRGAPEPSRSHTWGASHIWACISQCNHRQIVHLLYNVSQQIDVRFGSGANGKWSLLRSAGPAEAYSKPAFLALS